MNLKAFALVESESAKSYSNVSYTVQQRHIIYLNGKFYANIGHGRPFNALVSCEWSRSREAGTLFVQDFKVLFHDVNDESMNPLIIKVREFSVTKCIYWLR